jgi:hypothetical protein
LSSEIPHSNLQTLRRILTLKTAPVGLHLIK